MLIIPFKNRGDILITRLLIIAILPSISVALAIYLSDRYDKEPIKLLLKAFISGVVIVIPILIVEKLLVQFNIFYGILGIAYTSFIVAGLIEEYFKRSAVLRIAYSSKYFDEKLDGIVYSVFISLGFATIENIMYLLRFSNFNPYVGLYRGILSVPAHSIFAVTMGYYVSLAKFSDNEKKEKNFLNKSLYMPIILHGTFNFILMLGIPQANLIFIPYIIYLWKTNQSKLSIYMKESKKRHYNKDIDELEL